MQELLKKHASQKQFCASSSELYNNTAKKNEIPQAAVDSYFYTW